LLPIEVCAKVDTARFELQHLSRKMDWMVSLTSDGAMRTIRVTLTNDQKISLFEHLTKFLQSSFQTQRPTAEKEWIEAKVIWPTVDTSV